MTRLSRHLAARRRSPTTCSARGKTAVRFNLGHYLAPRQQRAELHDQQPGDRPQTTQTRNWTDRDGDFVVDCDLSPTAIAAQDVPGGDVCGPVTGAGLNFGSVVRTRTVNPDVLHGWGVRPYDWVFDGVDPAGDHPAPVGGARRYNRRHWGNFFVDDNLNLGRRRTSTSRRSPRRASRTLPDGGGYPISFRVPRTSAAVNNYYTFAERLRRAHRDVPQLPGDRAARARSGA